MNWTEGRSDGFAPSSAQRPPKATYPKHLPNPDTCDSSFRPTVRTPAQSPGGRNDMRNNRIDVKSGETVAVLTSATRKGGFILSSDQSRRDVDRSSARSTTMATCFTWCTTPGTERTVVSAVNSMFWGAKSSSSVTTGVPHGWTPLTKPTHERRQRPHISTACGTSSRGRRVERTSSVMYAGGAPASLFRSMDWGNIVGAVVDR